MCNNSPCLITQTAALSRVGREDQTRAKCCQTLRNEIERRKGVLRPCSFIEYISRDFEIWYMWCNWDPLPIIIMSWAVYCWHFKRWMCLEMCPVHWSFRCPFWADVTDFQGVFGRGVSHWDRGLCARLPVQWHRLEQGTYNVGMWYMQTQLASVFRLMYPYPLSSRSKFYYITNYKSVCVYCMHTHAIQAIAEK